jgi:hypothetical protein
MCGLTLRTGVVMKYFFLRASANSSNDSEVLHFIESDISGITPIHIEISEDRFLSWTEGSNTRYIRYVRLTLTDTDFMYMSLKVAQPATSRIVSGLHFRPVRK